MMVKSAQINSQPEAVEMQVDQLSRLDAILAREHNLSLSSYRDGCIRRRLSTRIKLLGLNSLSQYLDLLESNPEEARRLIDTLTISFTSFFRDPETFHLITEKIAPDIIKSSGRKDAQVKIWSAGCSTGEEAYSLAISFLQADPELAHQSRMRIWATDIDEEAIEQARQGLYPKDRLQNLDEELKHRYLAEESGGWRVKPSLKKLIDFRRENLLSPGFSGFEGMDMVICRNLLIYLENQEQSRMLGNFERSLRDQGYLIIGKTEFLPEPYRSRFEHISPSERIYKKTSRSISKGLTGGNR